MIHTVFTLRSGKRHGFTLLEVIIALAIIGTLTSIVLASMSTLRARQTLDSSIEKTLSAFSHARLDTISSMKDSVYGVRVLSDRVIYFKGAVYPGDNDSNNLVLVLPPLIIIANISLNGGGSDIIFQRLTGATQNYGTFNIQAKGNATIFSTLAINQSGAVSI